MEDKKKNIKLTAVTGAFEKNKVEIVDSGEITIVKSKEEKTKEQDDLIV